MLDSLKLEPRTTRYGCGIYGAGDTEKCYVELFVTDDGFVLPVNHRIISADDLMEVYIQGRSCRDVSHALLVLAEDLMESGLEIAEMIEELRGQAIEAAANNDDIPF